MFSVFKRTAQPTKMNVINSKIYKVKFKLLIINGVDVPAQTENVCMA